MFLLIKLFDWLDSIVIKRRYMKNEAPPADELEDLEDLDDAWWR